MRDNSKVWISQSIFRSQTVTVVCLILLMAKCGLLIAGNAWRTHDLWEKKFNIKMCNFQSHTVSYSGEEDRIFVIIMSRVKH